MTRIVSPPSATLGARQLTQLAADVKHSRFEEREDPPVSGTAATAEQNESPDSAQELQDLPSDLTTLSLEQLMNLRVRAREPEEGEGKDKGQEEITEEVVEVENPAADQSNEFPPARNGGGGADFTSFEAVVLGENSLLAETSAREPREDDEAFVANVQIPVLAPLSDALPSPVPIEEESDTVPLNLVDPDSELPLLGGPGNDFLVGGPGDDSIQGLGGDDYLEGAGGNDTLDGGADGDVVIGGSGDDIVLGSGGNDYLEGGKGNDILDGGPGKDTLIAGEGDDVLVWDFPDITLDGGAGSDTLRVMQGDVDISNFHGNFLSVEVVDLASDPNPNSLILHPQDVLDISDSDILAVLGGVNDSVDAGSGWTYTGRNTEGHDVYIQDVSGEIAKLVLDPDLSINPDIVT